MVVRDVTVGVGGVGIYVVVDDITPAGECPR